MKRIISIVCLMLSLVMTVSGCATIMSGNKQKIPVTSRPAGATVTCDNGTMIITPGSVILSTKEVHTLVATLPGYEPQQKALFKKLNNWVFADILWDFGIITIPIDLISGAACELQPKEVRFSLKKNQPEF